LVVVYFTKIGDNKVLQSVNCKWRNVPNLWTKNAPVYFRNKIILNPETETETSFGTIRNKMFVSVVSLLYRSFGVSVEPKQTEDQPKEFDREHIWYFFIKFCVVSGCFGLFRFVSVCVKTVCFGCFELYTKTASFDVSIEPKQTEDQPKQFDREHILAF
jgi:hypothetical protein